MNYALHLLTYFCIYATAGLGLNVVIGYCGLLSLAQAAFFAIGCYCYALGTLAFHWNVAAVLLSAIALASVLSLAVSLPSWRLRGDFFVMASLAVQAMVMGAINNWSEAGQPIGSIKNLTNGPSGLPGIPQPELFGIRIATEASFAALGAVMLASVLIIAKVILRSPWGRALQAMRDDELAARGLGKNVRFLKVQAVLMSAVFAAVSGTLYAAYVGYIDPSVSSLDHSVLMLSMVIVGGVGTVFGPILGAAILTGVPEMLRYINVSDQVAGSIRLMVLGLLLVGLMHTRPQGAIGRLRLE